MVISPALSKCELLSHERVFFVLTTLLSLLVVVVYTPTKTLNKNRPRSPCATSTDEDDERKLPPPGFEVYSCDGGSPIL